MIERAIADGCRLAGAGRQRVWRQLRVRRRVRCEGLGYAVGLHRTTTVWRLDLLGRRIGDPVAVGDLADAIGRGGFRRVTWREGTKGKMSSRFATERVVLAQDDLVDPRSGKRSGCSWNGRMARRQRRTLPRPRCRRTCHGASSFGESSSGGAPNGVRGRQGRAWAGSLRGPLLPRLEPPCVHGAGLLRVYRRRALQGFSPLGRKNCHAESVASSRRCGRQPARSGTSGIPSSLCAWPSRASWPHGYPRCPLCHRPRSMAPPGAHAREHRRTTPFLNQ